MVNGTAELQEPLVVATSRVTSTGVVLERVYAAPFAEHVVRGGEAPLSHVV
jgi:hypothetical protein